MGRNRDDYNTEKLRIGMKARWMAALCIVAAVAASGCGISSPSDNTTETFKGLLDPGGSSVAGQFSVGNTGEVTITITSLTPTTNVALGILPGQLSGSTCT